MRALWTLRSLNGPVINSVLICCWTPSIYEDEFRLCEGKLRQLIFSRCSSGLCFDKHKSDAPQRSHFLAGFLTAYKNRILHGTNIFMNNGV